MTNTKLVAYHNNPKIKEKYLARVRAHVKADQLVHGQYWEDGKGCAVGCTIHSGYHQAYEIELGIPRILAHLEDRIFESLPNGQAQQWPEQFLQAIPVGADLSSVWPRFAIWMLTDADFGAIQFAKEQEGKVAIQNVADAYRQLLDDPETVIDWRKLRVAAYAVTAYVAAYAANAANAAAIDAYAATTATAAADAAAYAIRVNYGKWNVAQSEKLLELLASANGGKG